MEGEEVGAWDSVLLDPLTEETFIGNLHHRFKRDHIYTYIGNVLVSVNPYKELALYSSDLRHQYTAKGPFQLPPHIFAMAGSAFRGLRDRNEDQCLVVTGESGAGKTEAARQLLAVLPHHCPLPSKPAKELSDRILHVPPILQAFGNAKTARNDNSSRFSRVTHLAPGDRNYHIFYQLITGADVPLLKLLKLQRNVENYCFLECGRTLFLDTIDDRRDFSVTRRSLEIVGLSSEEILNVFKIVASVLKLGNVNFVPTNNIDGTEGCKINNEYELFDTCELLGTAPSVLETALTCVAGDAPLAELSAAQATRRRNALCRALYTRMFTWLVTRLNHAIKVKQYGKKKVLGILDIYGFEVLEQNGFEQFIINFCNEKLNGVITESTLKLEQDEYLREGIEWAPVQFSLNTTVCDIIEKNNHGILCLLDDVSRRANDETEVKEDMLLGRVLALCGHSQNPDRRRHTPTSLSDNSLPPNCFRLKHFAGTVTYNISGFVDKNVDYVRWEMSQAMFASSHPLLKSLFPEGNPKRGIGRRPPTVGAQFKVAVGGLVRTLVAKRAHYVRCIKPNELKLPRIFEMALVQHQVRYLGLLETVQVRRCGFCHRQAYPDFLGRYKMLSLHTWPVWPGAPVEGVSYLLRDLPIPNGEFAFGRTKLFIRSPRSECRFGIPFDGRRHLWCLYKIAREEYRILKRRKLVDWAVRVIQRHFIRWKRREFLMYLAERLSDWSDSPVCREWPHCPSRLAETSLLLRRIHHKWRCHKYRMRFDQTARNRMREKVTASLIFKDRKSSYPRSVSHPFLGDYVRLRQNVQWKKASVETNDQYVVFADIINKITRSSGKFAPILLVLSTSALLILDQRTLQIKYRVPASEIYRLSLSPYLDDVAVFHVRASGELGAKKGDFVFQTGHVIEIVTKLFLVVQNAVGKPPQVNITTEFEANFGHQTVIITFKCVGLPEVQPGQIRVVRKSGKMEILL